MDSRAAAAACQDVEADGRAIVVQKQMTLPVCTLADLMNWWQAASSSRTVTSATRAMVPTILQE